MINKIISKLLIIAFCIVLITLSGWNSKTSIEEEWRAPSIANKLQNPLKNNSAATESGKKLYKQFCTICHGKSGRGEGIGGMSLTPRPANFTTEIVQRQIDGAIYWKITEGRAPMASYKTALRLEQRWQLVNYIRSLKK